MSISRRQFGVAGLATLAFSGLACRGAGATATDSYRNEIRGYGALKPDPKGYFDLPEGFSYRVLSTAGEAMDDGFVAPDNFDGMGCLPLGGSRVALIRNHELGLGATAASAAGDDSGRLAQLDSAALFGRDGAGKPMSGGTTTLVYDLKTGRREASFLSLAGTAVNCAGGTTPWGSWLSCEESVLKPDATQQHHGWVFEVPAGHKGLADPVPLKAMGRFRHEAAAVDPDTGIVYLTEDREDGLFYRFLPAEKGVLARGGTLQALAFADPAAGGDSRNWSGTGFPPGTSRAVRWVDLDNVESPDDDLRQRGAAKGAVLFARGEGIHGGLAGNGGSEFFFTCTSGGAGRLGQIMRYAPGKTPAEGGQLTLFHESRDPLLMDYADNLVIAPWGHLIICEDRKGNKINHLRGLSPGGKVYTLARLNADTELAGACFSPDGRTLFVNAYRPGRTLAITGPWGRVSLDAA